MISDLFLIRVTIFMRDSPSRQTNGITTLRQFDRDEEETGYPVILSNNDTCLVPWEVLVSPVRYVYVSVFADDLITANKESVLVRAAGYASDVIEPSTPDVYTQIMTRLEEVEAYVDDRVENIDGGLFTDWNN